MSRLFPNVEWELVTEPGGETFRIYTLGRNEDGSVWELALLQPGLYRPHVHRNTTSLIEVLEGDGVALVDEVSSEYDIGSKFEALKGVSHGFVARTDTLLLTWLSKPIKDSYTGELDLWYL